MKARQTSRSLTPPYQSIHLVSALLSEFSQILLKVRNPNFWDSLLPGRILRTKEWVEGKVRPQLSLPEHDNMLAWGLLCSEDASVLWWLLWYPHLQCPHFPRQRMQKWVSYSAYSWVLLFSVDTSVLEGCGGSSVITILLSQSFLAEDVEVVFLLSLFRWFMLSWMIQHVAHPFIVTTYTEPWIFINKLIFTVALWSMKSFVNGQKIKYDSNLIWL